MTLPTPYTAASPSRQLARSWITSRRSSTNCVQF